MQILILKCPKGKHTMERKQMNNPETDPEMEVSCASWNQPAGPRQIGLLMTAVPIAGWLAAKPG